MYLEKTYAYADIIEVQKTYSRRYGIHSSRNRKQKATKQSVADYNDRLAVRELARTIKANFSANDIHLTLTYKRECRPEEIETAKKQRNKFLSDLKKIVGEDFRYIASTAIGSHGAMHHHLIISYTDPREFRRVWKYGSCYTSYLDGGDYTELARYILGQKQKSKHPERMSVRRWSSSRNVKRVKPEIRQVRAKKWREPPMPRKGYIIDVDSIESNVNPVTGIPYLYYRLKRIDKPIKRQRKEVNKEYESISDHRSGKTKRPRPPCSRLGKQM